MNYLAKAEALFTAWKARGAAPSRRAALNALAVALHETNLGEAGGVWEGLHNWGARQLTKAQGGLLTDVEAKVLTDAKLTPTSDANVVAARAFSGKGIAPRVSPPGALLRDSYPTDKGQVPYWVFFWAAANDVDGAAAFLDRLLTGNVPTAVEGTDLTALAKAMYESKYFGGFSTSETTAVNQYASALTSALSVLEVALNTWPPSTAPLPVSPPGSTVAKPEPMPSTIVTPVPAGLPDWMLVLQSPLPGETPGEHVARIVRAFVGVSLVAHRDRLDALFLVNETAARAHAEAGVTTNCGTAFRCFFALANCHNHFITQPYESGMAVSWDLEAARECGALLDAHELVWVNVEADGTVLPGWYRTETDAYNAEKVAGPGAIGELPHPEKREVWQIVGPGWGLHYDIVGTNDDHMEIALSLVDPKTGVADHGGGGRADNAITMGTDDIRWSVGRPLQQVIAPEKMGATAGAVIGPATGTATFEPSATAPTLPELPASPSIPPPQVVQEQPKSAGGAGAPSKPPPPYGAELTRILVLLGGVTSTAFEWVRNHPVVLAAIVGTAVLALVAVAIYRHRVRSKQGAPAPQPDARLVALLTTQYGVPMSDLSKAFLAELATNQSLSGSLISALSAKSAQNVADQATLAANQATITQLQAEVAAAGDDTAALQTALTTLQGVDAQLAAAAAAGTTAAPPAAPATPPADPSATPPGA